MIHLRKLLYSGFCTSKDHLIKAQKYIHDNVQSKEWIFYMQGNYIPKDVRNAFYAIHWLNHQVSKIPVQTRDTSLALGKLRFWQDNIDSIFAGNLPNAEPISQSLRNQCELHPISKIHFDRIIQAKIFETNFRTVNTLAELLIQCQKIYSSIIIATLQMLQVPINDDMVEAALEVGRAIGLCHYIKQTPYTLRLNRYYLPQDISDKHNINLGNIWERVNGKPRQELFDVVLQIAAFAKQSLQLAKRKQSSLPPEAFRAYLGAIETELYLQDLQKANFDIFSQGVNKPSIVKFPYRLHTAAKKGNFLYN